MQSERTVFVRSVLVTERRREDRVEGGGRVVLVVVVGRVMF